VKNLKIVLAEKRQRAVQKRGGCVAKCKRDKGGKRLVIEKGLSRAYSSTEVRGAKERKPYQVRRRKKKEKGKSLWKKSSDGGSGWRN